MKVNMAKIDPRKFRDENGESLLTSDDLRHDVEHLPTPEEIKEQTAKIREQWDDAKLQWSMGANANPPARIAESDYLDDRRLKGPEKQ